jgi:hypothetical protein
VCDSFVVDTLVKLGTLETATRYYRRVNAINITGSGPFSSPSYFTTIAEQDVLPAAIQLDQNFPNPFNPTTTIRFRLPVRTHVSLRVYNMLGAEVAVLVDAELQEGEHSVAFNGAGLASGAYLCRLQANGGIETRKMILAR